MHPLTDVNAVIDKPRFDALEHPPRAILFVGCELDLAATQRLTIDGFVITRARSLDEAYAFVSDRLCAAIVIGDHAASADVVSFVRWTRSQERLAFVQIFVSAARFSITAATCIGADDTFNGVDVDVANRIISRTVRAHALAELALVDPLTKLHNRRFMNERLQAEVARAARTNAPFAIALIDLDDFKCINDAFGHATGDRALVAFANALRRYLRAYDLVCRFGGDEFVVLFPNCDVAGAVSALLKVRSALCGRVVSLPPMTFSAGIAQFPDDGDTWPALFAVADRRALSSKHRGRDRATIRQSVR